MSQVSMPRLSDSMEEGTILEWLVEHEAEVKAGDPLVEIETDKASMVYEAEVSGVVHHIAQVGDSVPLGAAIAEILDPGAERDNGAASASQVPSEETSQSPASPPLGPGESAAGAGESPAKDDRIQRVKASPLARRIAKQHGLELDELTGSGPAGRIVKADLEAAFGAAMVSPTQSRRTSALEDSNVVPTLEESPISPGPLTAPVQQAETARGQTEAVELTKLQQTVARRMAESKAVAPHFYLQAEIDMSRCVEARNALKARAGADDLIPSFNDMVVKAVALALGDFPTANGSYKDGGFELHSRINIGIAIAAPAALVVATIFDVDDKGLRQIASETRDLAAKVKAQTITPPELSGATFTVSNLGMYGVTNFHPIINLPQAAILAVGAIRERPVIRDSEISGAHLMEVSLACDHRILYGADGAQLLARITSVLEEPLGLAL